MIEKNNKLAFSSTFKKAICNAISSTINGFISRAISRFITKLMIPLLMAGLLSVFATQTHAAKPEHAGADKGKGKASEQIKKEKHRMDEEHREYSDGGRAEQRRDRAEEKHQTMMEDSEELRDGAQGLDKQYDRKMEQEQKELGKGSEKGQEMREEHRRKWWKFWEE